MMTLMKIMAALALAPVTAIALVSGAALAQTPSDESYEGIEIYLDGSDTPAGVGDVLILGDGEVDGVSAKVDKSGGGAFAWTGNAVWGLYLLAVFGALFGVGALCGRMAVGFVLRDRRRRS